MNPNLRQAYEKVNNLWEKEPFLVCDRWCEQCDRNIQKRCNIFQIEMELELISIASDKQKEYALKGEQEQSPHQQRLAQVQEEIEQYKSQKPLDDVNVGRLKHELIYIVENYTKKMYEMFWSVVKEKPRVGLKKALSDILLYSVEIGIKAYRVSGFSDGAKIGFDEQEDREGFVTAYLLMKKDIQRSLKALRIVKVKLPEKRSVLLQAIALLGKTEDMVGFLEKDW